MSPVIAPTGWGYLPGAVLAGDAMAMLPELPLLSVLRDGNKMQAVIDAISSRPGLARCVRPIDLQRKYGIPQSTASTVLQTARRSA